MEGHKGSIVFVELKRLRRTFGSQDKGRNYYRRGMKSEKGEENSGAAQLESGTFFEELDSVENSVPDPPLSFSFFFSLFFFFLSLFLSLSFCNVGQNILTFHLLFL